MNPYDQFSKTVVESTQDMLWGMLEEYAKKKEVTKDKASTICDFVEFACDRLSNITKHKNV